MNVNPHLFKVSVQSCRNALSRRHDSQITDTLGPKEKTVIICLSRYE